MIMSIFVIFYEENVPRFAKTAVTGAILQFPSYGDISVIVIVMRCD